MLIGLQEMMDKHVPSKMTSTRYNLPWLNQKLKRMTKKKQKLYNKAKKSKSAYEWDKFRSYKKRTKNALKNAHTEFISNVLDKSLKSKDPKPFWKYIKQLRNDSVGVAPMKEKGSNTLVSDSMGKAEILNQQFKSVFTKSNYDKPLRLDGDKITPIADLHHLLRKGSTY